MTRSERPLFEVSKIETPEQIELELPLAGVGTRAAAYIIDLVWQAVPLIVIGIAAFLLLPEDVRPSELFLEDQRRGPRVSQAWLMFIGLIVFATNFGYYVLFELRWKGQSPGKRALGLRVVRDGGYPIDGRAALIRNLLRAVDILPTSYLVGILAVFIGRQGKRVGDYAAGTIVVMERAALTEPWVQAEGRAARQPSTELRLTPAERRLLDEFLARRSQLAPDARERIAGELAASIAARLNHPAPREPEAFLEGL